MTEKNDDYALPYEVSSAFKSNPVHDCYVNLETEPKQPMRLVYGKVYPAFPYKLTSADDQHLREDPARTWEVLRSLREVPEAIPGKLPRGYE